MQDIVKTYMWQSRVEIEHYSVAYFARIAAFEALVSAHQYLHVYTAPPLTEVLRYSASNAAIPYDRNTQRNNVRLAHMYCA